MHVLNALSKKFCRHFRKKIFYKMAMLADPKSKQKWSQDPRNTQWSRDKDRYGYQMLEKMGWADGKGLGKNKSGNTAHVKIRKRKQNLGLGAKESHDNDWIAQQEDFNNLLSALQQHGGNAELQTEEQNKKAMLEVAKASRKRVFYKKFIKGKDTSQYSQKDMACIFGNFPSQSAPATPLNQSDDEVASEDSTASCPTIPCDSGFVTYTSKQNIQEYFASRMKELQGGKGIEESKEGESGVRRENLRNDDMDNQGDDGDNFDVDKNLDNCAEVNSRESKKRKKSKIEGKCSRDEAKTKKSKKRKMKDYSDMIGSVVENGIQENELFNEKDFCERNKTKPKKSKKRARKSSETTGNSVESIANENNNVCCNDDVTLSAKERDKAKTKKGEKQRTYDVENIPIVVENGVDNEPEQQNEESSSFGKKDKVVKRKKSKKRKFESFDSPEMMANVVEDKKDENNLDQEEQSVCLKEDGVKRKKNKKKTKRDKKHD